MKSFIDIKFISQLGRVRVSRITNRRGYWGFGFDKTPHALVFHFGHTTIDIFWGYKSI